MIEVKLQFKGVEIETIKEYLIESLKKDFLEGNEEVKIKSIKETK
jgi:hypothetical protein